MVLFFKLLNYFSLKKIIQNKPQSELIIGIFWIILSVIGYSLLPLFGNLAYKSGVVLSTAVFIRFITATFFLEIHSLVQPLIKPNKKTAPLSWQELSSSVGIGVIYTIASFCYFASLKYLSPVIFSFLYYTYPMMTIFLGVSFFNEKIQRLHIISAALFLGGLLLLLGNSEVSIQWQGIIWVLGCAFFTALYFQCQKFLSPKKDKVYHAKIMMRTMSFLFFLWWLQDGMPLNGLIGNGLIDNGLVENTLVGSGWIWLFLIGFICTYVAITANIIGVAILGASNSALLSGQEPVWTAFFSFLVLGITLTNYQWLGGLLFCVVFLG